MMPKDGADWISILRSISSSPPTIRRVDRAELRGILRVLRHVVDLAIGDQDGAGDALARRIRQGRLQRDVEVRAVRAGIGLGDAQLQRFVGVDLRLEGVVGGLGRLRAAAEVHAFRPVHHHRDDVLERLALFLDPERIGEGQRQDGQRQRAQQPGLAAQEEIDDPQHDGAADQRPEQGPGDERIERKAGRFEHGLVALSRSVVPSRSSRSGTWTWSSL